MKRASSILAIIFCVALAGCGVSSSGSGPNSTNNATMQQGQWEFAIAPNNSNPVYLDANLIVSSASNSGSGDDVSSTAFNTLLFVNGGAIANGLFGSCTNLAINGTLSGNTLTVFLISPGSSAPNNGSFSGTISNNGLSVSNGSYSILGMCGFAPANTGGTITGYTIAPVNGTFSGTLTDAFGNMNSVVMQMSQNSNFGITASGTSTASGVITNLSIAPNVGNGGFSNVIGATIQATGTGTNISGNSQFQVFGHFNPAATQITLGFLSGNVWKTGVLTKQ
jgi:hypothetical protein